MKTVYGYCLNSESCEVAKKLDKTQIIILGQEIPEGMAAKHDRKKCARCGHEWLEVSPKKSLKRMGYPYYNDSCGVTFESESHEKKYVQENNMVQAG